MNPLTRVEAQFLEVRHWESNTSKYYMMISHQNYTLYHWGRVGFKGQNQLLVPWVDPETKIENKLKEGYRTVCHAYLEVQENDPEGTINEVKTIFDIKESIKHQPLVAALKEEGNHQVILTQWSNWNKGWSWRQEAVDALKQRAYVDKEKDVAWVNMTAAAYLLLMSHTNLQQLVSTRGTGSRETFEIASSLWTPRERNQPYSNANYAYQTALELTT